MGRYPNNIRCRPSRSNSAPNLSAPTFRGPPYLAARVPNPYRPGNGTTGKLSFPVSETD
jgi:hypothetical protein